MGQVVEKTDLELYEEQLDQLKDRIRDLDYSAWRALKAIEEKKSADFDFDPERYRTLKAKLLAQQMTLETKWRTEKDRVLKARRVEKERELKDLQPELNATKAAYHEAQEILERAWKAHSLLEIKAYNIEEGLRLDYEDMRSNQRFLQELIRSITGVEELDHDDGLSANQQNLLIRN
jgi:hypothetical protein